MRPAPLHRTPALAWLMARAFTPNRATATIAWLIAFAALTPYTLRGGLYESADRDGMVVVARWRPVTDVVLSVLTLIVIAAPVGVLGAIISDLTGMPGQIVIIVVAAWMGIGSALLSSAEATTLPVGRETPTGQRWQIAALAQRPGTRTSALALARNVVADLPPAAILVAVAGSQHLLSSYRRLGFTHGQKARVWARQDKLTMR